MKTQKPVVVEIFGQQYTLLGDADESYVQELARYVDKKMREVAAKTKTNDLRRLAVLSAINIAHEFRRLTDEQHQHQMAIRQIGRKTRDLIESIEEEFDDLQLQ
ncbi:MAG TPA: cell division protein ZapA [Nitrospiria bacterium]|nr:cell division protein ZapA [Nitrospiria bacterium]